MKRTLLSWALLAILAVGCSGKNGNGITLDKTGLHIGTSLEERDRIARERAEAEIRNEREETAARVERAARESETNREVLRNVGVAAAMALGIVGIGYAGKLITPLAGQAVAGLQAALAVRQAKQFEINLKVTPGGCQARFLAQGYTDEEIAKIVHNAPALDAPRLQELQGRVGDRGLRLLAERGEIEDAITCLEVKNE